MKKTTKRILQAERRVGQLRAFVGPQLLLDVLRVHVCSADRTPPRKPRRTSTSAAPAAATPPPTHAANGAVIARPVSPKRKGGGGGGGEGESSTRGDGDGDGATGAVVGEPLERCVGACMRMLRAMLRSELSATDDAAATASRSSSFVEAAGGGGGGGAIGVNGQSGGGGGGIDASERAKYLRMSFLEEDFGDAFGLDGSGWKDGVLREAVVDGALQDAAAGAGAGVPGETTTTGIDAAVVCLQECQSPDLQRGVLGVLLVLREDEPTKHFLRRELLR